MANLLQSFEAGDTLLFISFKKKRVKWAAKVIKKEEKKIRLIYFPLFYHSGFNYTQRDDFNIPDWDETNTGIGKWIIVKISPKDYESSFKKFNKIMILDGLDKLDDLCMG